MRILLISELCLIMCHADADDAIVMTAAARARRRRESRQRPIASQVSSLEIFSLVDLPFCILTNRGLGLQVWAVELMCIKEINVHT